jgi:ribose transport system substrate-binding protein
MTTWQELRSRRRFLQEMAAAGFVVPTAGALLSACGDDEPSGPISGSEALDKRRVFLDSFPTLNNDFWQAWDGGSVQACAALNMDHRRAVDDFDVAKQRAAIENAPTDDVEGLFTIANTEGASPDLLGLCQELGIYAVNNYSNAPWSTPPNIGDHYVAYHDNNNVEGARILAEAMFEEIGGRGKLIHIEGVRGNTSSDKRTAGVDLALKNYPDIELVGRQPGDYSRVTTQPVIEDLLTANPDVDAVFAQNDDAAIAVVNALEARGIDAPVVGIDAISEFLQMIAEGRAFATLANPGSWIGAWSAVRVFDALNGWKPKTPERMMYFGAFIVDTPDSATAYDELFYKSDKYPYDYKKWSRILSPKDWDPQNILVPMKPEEVWAGREKPDGYELPEEYSKAESDGEFERITKLYADHYKSDPWAEIRRATKNGGENIV